jgi:NAD(P)H dehydrogenase (quinone)
MTHPRILVTGASGKTGSAVTRQLLAAGVPVRALVRRRDSRSDALHALGAEIAVADMSDAEPMTRALTGVQRAYFVAGFDPAMLQQAVVFATAAREAGLEHIVQMTQWLASPSHPAASTRQHWLADRVMAMVPGIGHTLIEPGFFADMPYLSMLPYAAHLGIYPWPFGAGRNAPPSVEDIAAVVVAALLDPKRHASHRYRPTGPELLDGLAAASVIGKVIGRSVRLVPMPFGLFLRAARLDGLPITLLAMLRHYAADHAEGAFELGAPNDHVRTVTGRAAESFERVTQRHVAQLRRGWGATWKQLAKFLLVPLVPPPPVERYVRGLHLPQPALPKSAAGSDVWRREHGVGSAAERLSAAHVASRAAARTSQRPPMNDTLHQHVRAHYAAAGLIDRVSLALAAVAPEDAVLTPEQLAALDQFHTRGLAATIDLGEAMALRAGERVLDLGCGLGGPARMLASRFSVTVTGVDLSAAFVETGRYLNARCGLESAVDLRIGDALAPPIDDARFDAVVLQHVAMNIADRQALYGAAFGALRPGGRLAIHDVVKGAGELVFPVPWSREPATSHLLSEEQTAKAIEAAGLKIECWQDDTATALEWFASVVARGGPLPGPHLGLVIGPDFAVVTGNLARNLREGGARIVMALARKPGQLD